MPAPTYNPSTAHLDVISSPPSTSQGGVSKMTSADESALNASILRKYDFRILPVAFVAWTFFYLDRAAIALAYVNGMGEDLKLQGTQYNMTLLIFFVLYIVFSLPGNLILRRLGGGRFLPIIIGAWGLITTFTGFTKSLAGLCVSRILLGMAESAYLGGMMLYLGFFYTEFELVSRVGIFYSGNALAGAVGGFLAGGLGQIRFRGYNGWPWIYFIEGILTVVLALAAYAVLPNSPETATFLTDQERVLAVERMLRLDRRHEEFAFLPRQTTTAAAAGADNEEKRLPGEETMLRGRVDGEGNPVAQRDRLRWSTFKKAIFNPVTLMLALATWLCIAALYSFAFFLPLIVRTMGYKGIQMNLMTVPPCAAGFIFTILVTQYSQRSGRKAYPIMGCAVLAMLGYVLLKIGADVDARYMARIQYSGTFFVSMGINAMPPLALAWTSINASPHYIRAIVLGFIISIGNTASFLSAYTYIPSMAPK